MLQTFTEDQLLQMIKQRMGISTSACGAEVVTQQSADIDTTLRLCLQARYLNLLCTADPTMLPTRDIAMQASSFSTVSDGVGCISLPDTVLRPVSVKLPEWDSAVSLFVAHDSPEGMRIRLNPYSRSTARPKVTRQDNTLWLYNTSAQSRLLPERLDVIMKPTPGTYTLDIRLLQEITAPVTYLFDKY